ncbi:MAG: Sensor histidine kinase RcsC [Syntrophus sp. SKADARSKE-3]|nr:Sensor histidine kinase RcsC [Syntrophus sp. SKADARSKE-3]
MQRAGQKRKMRAETKELQILVDRLKRSEEEYRELVESVNSIILRMDNTGCVTFFNKFAQRFFGYRPEHIIGKNAVGAIVPDNEAAVRDLKNMIEDISENPDGYENVTTENIRSNGERVWVAWNIKPIRDENHQLVGVLCVGNDITERKRVEKALKESENEYRNIFDNAIEGIFQTMPDGRYRSINPAFAHMFGYESPEEMKSAVQNIGEQLSVNETDRTRLIEMMQVSQGMVRGFNVQLKRKDGSLFWVSINAQLVSKEGEESPYLEGTCMDISDRKQAEEVRLLLEERLIRAEKMEGLGRLAGGVAHDMNNVLGVLVGYSELLKEKIPIDSPLRKYAENILKSGLRGAAIIQDLLTMARRSVAVSEVVNLNRVVSDYTKTLEYRKLKSDHPEVNVRINLTEGLLNIKGSPIHLSKTLVNLVSNAAEAISGQGEITIKTENRYLDVPIQGYDDMREGDYAVLSISDTGNGIPVKDLGKIFEPFYTKKVMGRSGTGLGLAVVWGAVKDHNGYIDVQSEEGKGSTFTIYLPVTREKMMELEKAVDSAVYRGKGETILVVDDVKEQRELATNMLEMLGYKVEAVSSGEAAIDYLQSKKIDLMVLDMIMEPGIDGYETYRQVLEMNPRQKAVIVSGFSETDRVKEVMEIGAGSFIRKPYILEKIGLAVRKELDRK